VHSRQIPTHPRVTYHAKAERNNVTCLVIEAEKLSVQTPEFVWGVSNTYDGGEAVQGAETFKAVRQRLRH
jgi:hypothetical protein